MDKRLYALKSTLDQISVSGQNNLDLLLGCMQTIDKMIREGEENEQDQAE